MTNTRLLGALALVATCAIVLLLSPWGRAPKRPVPASHPDSQGDDASPQLRGASDAVPAATRSKPTHTVAETDAPEPTALAGRVRRGTVEVAGHEVALRETPREEQDLWSVSTLPRVVSGVTDAQGAFRLEAPSGTYVLQVGPASSALHRRITVPAPSPLDVDLGAYGKIVVTVRSPERKALDGALAGLRAPDGAVRSQVTDSEGQAAFEVLPPGRYAAYGSRPGGGLAFLGDGVDVQLDAAATAHVEVVLTAAAMVRPAQPRPMRIAIAGSTDFEGWQARAMYRGSGTWTPVNGKEPVMAARGLDVRAPDGRRWKVWAKDEELAVGVLELPTSDVLWRGLLLDRATNAPLVGYTVFAHEAGSHKAWIGSQTNAAGEFEVRVVRGPDVRLTFYDPGDNKLRGMSFAVREDARSSSAAIQVRIPLPDRHGRVSIPVRRLEGFVRNKDGTPPPATGETDATRGGMISVSARVADPDGVMLLRLPNHTTGISATGAYAIDVYEAEAYSATIYTALDENGRPGRADKFQWPGTSATHDFELE